MSRVAAFSRRAATLRFSTLLWFLPLLLLAAFVLIQPARAASSSESAADGEGARAFLQEFGGRAVAVLTDDSLGEAQRIERFREIMMQDFEIHTIGRLALGRHWKSASEAERDEFTRLFQDFAVLTTAKRLSGYSGEQLEIGPARQTQTAGLVAVASRIHRPAGSAILVEWRLRENEGRWRIIDVVVEGVSMLQTQRQEFDAVIRNSGGLDGLLQKMRAVTRA